MNIGNTGWVVGWWMNSDGGFKVYDKDGGGVEINGG